MILGPLYVSLLHYPVRNKNGVTVASAVTNLDLHDIARCCRTYGVARFFVVTPLADQHKLVQRILSHWLKGAGGDYNPQRREALRRVALSENLEQVCGAIEREAGQFPRVIATSSRSGRATIDFNRVKAMRAAGDPCLLLFGTAWGLTDEFLDEVEFLLEPIRGTGRYNHLAVRCAAAIIIDRLCGTTE